MQTRNPLVEQIIPLSEPVEIDPVLWAEIGGGSPRNKWSMTQGLFRLVSEFAPTEG